MRLYTGLIVIVIISYATSTVSAQQDLAWRVCSVSPWIEADAKTLPAMLNNPVKAVNMSGPRNDWLTGAVAIAADQNTAVHVELIESPRLKGKVTLRVVGQLIEREQGRTIWDPLLGKAEIEKFGPNMVNYKQIADYPWLDVTPTVPAFLWLTADLRGVESGEHKSKLIFEDKTGSRRDVDLNINVLEAEIPVQSPMHVIAWQWASSDAMIKDFLEHGLDVTYRDHEKWWKQGARFLLFQFNATFHRKPLDASQKELIKKELDEAYALINKLKVPYNQWALYIADEPSDSTAKQDAEAVAYIRKLRPRTPIFTNPAWGIQADKAQNTATLEGTVNVLDRYTNIWCPYCWHLWDGTDVYKKLKSTKKPLWFYEIYTQAANQRPQVGRDALRMLAWNAWRYDTQGIGMFSANDVANNWWTDLARGSNGYANYSFTYPGVDGITSSRAFEALRQGLQEHKRLVTLKKLKARQAALDALVDTVFTASGKENGAVAIDSVREQMDRMLVRLSKEQQTSH